jgi:hypothetical protein
MAAIDVSVDVRSIPPFEAEAVLPLSIEANWNQTVADWSMMLSEGQGFGVRSSSGEWLGSSLVFPLGPKLSWISMVLVTTSARRRGIGTSLLRHCIDKIRADVKVAGLDATELGRPIYLPLGFNDLYTISRLYLSGGGDPEAAPRQTAFRALGRGDVEAAASFDASRTGMYRPHVLAYLIEQAPGQTCALESAGRLSGYALGRPGRTAFQIGPVVAENVAAALALFQNILDQVTGPIMVDVPDSHQGLQAFLKQRGAVRERGFMRMVSGEPPSLLADPAHVFALAGPELG